MKDKVIERLVGWDSYDVDLGAVTPAINLGKTGLLEKNAVAAGSDVVDLVCRFLPALGGVVNRNLAAFLHSVKGIVSPFRGIFCGIFRSVDNQITRVVERMFRAVRGIDDNGFRARIDLLYGSIHRGGHILSCKNQHRAQGKSGY